MVRADRCAGLARARSRRRALKSPLFGIGDEALVQIALRQRELPGRSWFRLLQKGRGPAGRGWSRRRRKSQAVAALAGRPAAARTCSTRSFHDGDVLAKFGAAVPAASAPGRAGKPICAACWRPSLDIERRASPRPYAFGARAAPRRGVRARACVAAPEGKYSSDGARRQGPRGRHRADARLRRAAAACRIPWACWSSGRAATRADALRLPREREDAAGLRGIAAARRAARPHREELNGLYVATTRARARLVLSSVRPARANEGSWWARLAEACETELPTSRWWRWSQRRRRSTFAIEELPVIASATPPVPVGRK